MDLQWLDSLGNLQRVSTRDFQFQQFCVRQSEAAMKVCTDATVFGAMAPVQPGDRVLDIGTGTGLLALMLAQLGAASVDAVEIDAAAAREAAENFRQSPWGERLQVKQGDIRDSAMHPEGRFDLVICNPPFFAEQTLSSDPQRRKARHADEVFVAELLDVVERVLDSRGLFYLLLPCDRLARLCPLAEKHGLYPVCRTDIRGYAHQAPKLAAATFARVRGPMIERCLTVYDAPRQYSAMSAAYLSDFLLRFAAGTGE
jgi:tRNA1Val (adenine37-N6)-methyltransferase